MRRPARSRQIHVLLVVAAIVLSVATYGFLAPLSSNVLSKTYQASEFSRLFILGEVSHVLNGDLNPKMFFEQDTSDIAFALGAGGVGSIDRTGEMLIFDGKAYIKPSDPTNYSMVTSSKVLTPFCFGLEGNVEPSAIYVLSSRENTGFMLSSIYERLSDKRGRMFAILGLAEFNEIDCTAIKLAPIYNESIIAPENRERYFHNLEPVSHRVGIFFGVVNNPNKTKGFTYDTSVEAKMFYTNPAEKGSSELRSHAHVLITSQTILQSPNVVTGQDLIRLARTIPIVDLGHLLTQSILKKATLLVYDIDRIVEVNAVQITFEDTSISHNLMIGLISAVSTYKRMAWQRIRSLDC